MVTLQKPQVRTVIDRLYAEAEASDPPILERVRAEMALLGGVFDDARLWPLLDNAFIPVGAETGRLLYMLVRSRRPSVAVEFGTSFGLSALHIAAALRDNGTGRLIATECVPAKATAAQEHLRQAGLDDLVEIRLGDAFQTLSALTAVEFLLLDGGMAHYLRMLKQLEPALTSGSLILADDTYLFPDLVATYLAYVRDRSNGFVSAALPIDDGLELSLRH